MHCGGVAESRRHQLTAQKNEKSMSAQQELPYGKLRLTRLEGQCKSNSLQGKPSVWMERTNSGVARIYLASVCEQSIFECGLTRYQRLTEG